MMSDSYSRVSLAFRHLTGSRHFCVVTAALLMAGATLGIIMALVVRSHVTSGGHVPYNDDAALIQSPQFPKSATLTSADSIKITPGMKLIVDKTDPKMIGNDVIPRANLRATSAGKRAWIDTYNQVNTPGYLTKFFVYLSNPPTIATSITYHVRLQVWLPVSGFTMSQPTFKLFWQSVQAISGSNIGSQGVLFELDVGTSNQAFIPVGSYVGFTCEEAACPVNYDIITSTPAHAYYRIIDTTALPTVNSAYLFGDILYPFMFSLAIQLSTITPIAPMCNRTTAGNDVISRRFIRETYGRKAWVDTQNKVASGGYLTKFYLYIGYVAPSTTYHIHLQIWQPVPDFQASQPQFTLLWDSVQNINKQGLFQYNITQTSQTVNIPAGSYVGFTCEETVCPVSFEISVSPTPYTYFRSIDTSPSALPTPKNVYLFSAVVYPGVYSIGIEMSSCSP